MSERSVENIHNMQKAYKDLMKAAFDEGGPGLQSQLMGGTSKTPYDSEYELAYEFVAAGKLQCLARVKKTLDKGNARTPYVLLQALSWLKMCALNVYVNPHCKEIATIAVSGRIARQ